MENERDQLLAEIFDILSDLPLLKLRAIPIALEAVGISQASHSDRRQDLRLRIGRTRKPPCKIQSRELDSAVQVQKRTQGIVALAR